MGDLNTGKKVYYIRQANRFSTLVHTTFVSRYILDWIHVKWKLIWYWIGLRNTIALAKEKQVTSFNRRKHQFIISWRNFQRLWSDSNCNFQIEVYDRKISKPVSSPFSKKGIHVAEEKSKTIKDLESDYSCIYKI